MLSYFIFLVYVGGFIPAYKHSRNNKINILFACLDAIAWPFDLGYAAVLWQYHGEPLNKE